MKKIVRAILFLAIPVLIAAACTHPNADIQPDNTGGTGTGGTGTGGTGGGTGGGSGGGTSGGTGGGTTSSDTALCFERDILPIFRDNCATSGCHDAATAEKKLILDSYANILKSDKFRKGDPDNTEIFEVLSDKDPKKKMPLGGSLSTTQIGLIYRWIKAGAPNSNGCTIVTGGGGNGCDSTKFTFSGTIQPLLNANCKSCHNTAGASSGVNLDNYNGVKIVAGDGRLLGAIKHLTGYPAMPQGGAKLSDCDIMLVEKWVASGALNN